MSTKGMTSTEESNFNRQRIKELVLSHGTVGISNKSIRAALSMGEVSFLIHINSLEAAGEVQRSHKTGSSVRWGAPGIYEAYRGAREKAAAQREKYGRRKAEREANKRRRAFVPASVWDFARSIAACST